MKNQIERASGGASDAAPHEPDAFEAAWLDYNKAGVAGGWEKVAFVGGFGRGFKAGRESGHVVLLEALRKLAVRSRSAWGRCMSPCDCVVCVAEAVIERTERP